MKHDVKPQVKSQTGKRAEPRAFTLIEILVVIAIIAVLAGILFPVISRARISAYKTTALSNVKQLETARQMYITDYDGMFPPYFSGLDPVTHTYHPPQLYWPSLILPYIAKIQGHGPFGQAMSQDLPPVFWDPVKPMVSQVTSTFKYGIYSGWGVSDDITDWIGTLDTKPSYKPTSLSAISSPAHCLDLLETYDWLSGGKMAGDALAASYFELDWSGAIQSVDAPYGADYKKSSRNQPADPKGRNMCSFADGHVASMVVGDLQNDPTLWSLSGGKVWR